MLHLATTIATSVLLSTVMMTSTLAEEKSLPEEAAKLTTIVSKYTAAVKKSDPYWAAYFNVEEDLDKFGDYLSKDYFDRQKKIVKSARDQLQGIRFEHLPQADRLLYRLFKEDIDVSWKAFDFPVELLSLNQMNNRLHSFMDESSEALTDFPFDSVKHYDDFIKRAKGFPAYVDNQIETLRRGIREKITLSCLVAEKVPNTYSEALVKDVEKNAFYRPVGFMPKTFSEADRKRLSSAFREVITSHVQPGYEKFDKFFRVEYLPHCRKSFGLTGIPNGKEWYKHAIRQTTNLDLEPKDIHHLGIKEVARILAEIRKIQIQLGEKGDVYTFMRKITLDKKMVFNSAKEMFDAFEKTKADVALKVPQYFSFIPKSDYKIVEASNPEDASGSYVEPSESMPFGRFIVNTKKLSSVPRFEVTTLSLHETIPGHHFQLAVQFEMKDQLSEYQRKVFSSGSFVEGWALYTEYLGNEMGLYTDPYQRFGHLNDEMLRAVRLVVDTGIHALGWSQSKAIAYMSKNLASDQRDAEIEINRYSVWPGQALGYKIGQLKIIELRKKAEQELGAKFDIKGFHKAVIGNGTVTLGVLETQVNDWIKSL